MFEIIKQNKVKFIVIWFIVFLGSFLFLSLFKLVPETGGLELETEIISLEKLEQKLAGIPHSLPKRVVIDEIGVDVDINNPESRSIDVLDNSLLSGAVRYPSSGLLGQKTNMLLLCIV